MTTRIILTITACALLGAGCSYSENGQPETVTLPVPSFGMADAASSTPALIDTDAFLIPELFEKPGSVGPSPCPAYRAGIVNHHALASDLITSFFETIKSCKWNAPQTFIILSPDHFHTAHAPIVTHRLSYETRGAVTPVCGLCVDRLQRLLPFVVEQPELFEREHGVGALVPFVQRKFPDAYVVPVVVRPTLTREEGRRLADWLAEMLEHPDVFVIVSADMSHYLDARTARKNDQETKQALETNDIAFFEQADDDHTDNGISIAVVVHALRKTKWTLLAESISSDYAGSPGFTTTYLIGFWN